MAVSQSQSLTTIHFPNSHRVQLQLVVTAQMKQLEDDIEDLTDQVNLEWWKRSHLMDSVNLFVLCLQILDLQRIEGRSGGIGGSQQEGDEVSVVDQVRRILHSQLDTLLWIDQQTGSEFCINNLIPLLIIDWPLPTARYQVLWGLETETKRAKLKYSRD